MANDAVHATDVHRVAFEAFGVPVCITVPSPELLTRVERVLPPGWRPTDPPPDGDHQFALTSPDGTSYRVEHERGVFSGSSDVDVALEVLDSTLRSYIAVRAPDRIFVHAGAVAHRGRAIVIPGPSFSGKTTLVAELVRNGATYYSDEYAVLDDEGLVHPYPKPLSLRTGLLHQKDERVEAFGGAAGHSPLPVGLVVMTRYRHGAAWQPARMSAGEGLLAMLANTVPAQDRPEESMNAIRRALEGASVIEGDRGEAADVVPHLLAALDG